MQRLIAFTILCSILATACAPQVTLLTEQPDHALGSTPRIESTATRSNTATPRATPPPTPNPDLSVDLASLRGVEAIFVHAQTGSAGTLLQKQVNLFNSTNQWGISIRLNAKASYADLLASINAENPDLALALPEHALEFSERAIDLAPYVSRNETGLEDPSDLVPQFVVQDQIDGKLSSLPFLRSARFLFYNLTWAEALGFNSAPKTTGEFRAQACAANQSWRSDSDESNDGYGGWLFDADSFTAASWFASFNGGILTDGELKFNTTENEAALSYLTELRDKGCAWIANDTQPFDHLAVRKALFISGNLGEAFDANSAFYRNGSKDQWTLIAFPNDVVIPFGYSFVITKSTPEKQMAAWLFARWMIDPARQSAWVEETGLMPVRSSLINSLSGYRSKSPAWSAAVDMIPLMKPYPQIAAWRNARQILRDGFLSIFRLSLPADSVSQILDQMQSMSDELAKP